MNNQNEQAQVSTNEQQQVNQTTNSKPKKKPLFQEGSLLHTIFYRITQRVQAGEISFAKVFWIGCLIIAVINVILVFVFGINQITKEILDVIWSAILVRHLWLARKQVYHPAWFYIGFFTPIALTIYSFYSMMMPLFQQ